MNTMLKYKPQKDRAENRQGIGFSHAFTLTLM